MNQNFFLTNHAPMPPSIRSNQSRTDPNDQNSQNDHTTQFSPSSLSQDQSHPTSSNRHLRQYHNYQLPNQLPSYNSATLDLKSLSSLSFAGLDLENLPDIETFSSLDTSIPSSTSSTSFFNPSTLNSNLSSLNNIGLGSLDAISQLNQGNQTTTSPFNGIPLSVNMAATSLDSSRIQPNLNLSHTQSRFNTPNTSTNTTPISLNQSHNHHQFDRAFTKQPSTPLAPNASSLPGPNRSSLPANEHSLPRQLPPYKGVSLACELEIDSFLGEDRILRRLQKRELKAINEIQTFRQEALDLCNQYAAETGDVQWLRLMILNNEFHHKTINDHFKTKQDAYIAGRSHAQHINTGLADNTPTNSSLDLPPHFKYLEEAREILKKVEIRDKRLEKLRIDFHDHIKSVGGSENRESVSGSGNYAQNLAPNSDSSGLFSSQVPGGFLPSPAPSTNNTTSFLSLSNQNATPATSSLEPLTPVASLSAATPMAPTSSASLYSQGSQPRPSQQINRQSQLLNSLAQQQQQRQGPSPLQQLTPKSMSSPSLVNQSVTKPPNPLWTQNQTLLNNAYLANNPSKNSVASDDGSNVDELNFDSLDNLVDLENLVNLNNLNNFNELNSLGSNMLDLGNSANAQTKDTNADKGSSNAGDNLSSMPNFSMIAAVGNLPGFDGLNIDFSDFSSFADGDAGSAGFGQGGNVNMSKKHENANATEKHSNNKTNLHGQKSVTRKRSFENVQSSTPSFSPGANPPMPLSATSSHHSSTIDSPYTSAGPSSLKSTPVIGNLGNLGQPHHALFQSHHHPAQIFSKASTGSSPFSTLSPSPAGTSAQPSPHAQPQLLSTSSTPSSSHSVSKPNNASFTQQQYWAGTGLQDNDLGGINFGPDVFISQEQEMPPVKKFHKIS